MYIIIGTNIGNASIEQFAEPQAVVVNHPFQIPLHLKELFNFSISCSSRNSQGNLNLDNADQL